MTTEVFAWDWRGLALTGLFTPPRRAGGDAPLVIYLGGGPTNDLSQLREESEPWADPRWALFVPLLPASGCVGDEAALAAYESRRDPGVDDDLDAVYSAIESLSSRYFAKPPPQALVGFSFGAYLVNRAITMTNRFSAAVAIEGVADLRALDEESMALQAEWLGGMPNEAYAQWSAASPIDSAQNVVTPTLLVYGEDWTLKTQGTRWADALVTAGVTTQLSVLAGQGHLFDANGQASCVSQGIDWLARHLVVEPSC